MGFRKTFFSKRLLEDEKKDIVNYPFHWRIAKPAFDRPKKT